MMRPQVLEYNYNLGAGRTNGVETYGAVPFVFWVVTDRNEHQEQEVFKAVA